MRETSTVDSSSPIIPCIMGPTASGKTSLAIEAAKALNGEVISVDSALVYSDMDIGTAKPSLEEQDGIKHHLIDIISPELAYSVADFISDVETVIKDIIARGKQPILAGGTMMYFNALINGLNQLPAADSDLREKISQMDLKTVHAELKKVDEKSASRINESDGQRLTRALEVYLVSGKSLSYWQAKEKQKLPFRFTQFSIMPAQRSTLHKQIQLRFDQMLANGFVNEVENLLASYTLHPDMPSMRSVGYRQVWQFLRGEYNASEMRERGIIATRQLAKRQLTWLRSWQELTPLQTGDSNNLQRLVQKVSAT